MQIKQFITYYLLYDWGKHGYTGHIGVYRVYSLTRVNMGRQDVQGYAGYTLSTILYTILLYYT